MNLMFKFPIAWLPLAVPGCSGSEMNEQKDEFIQDLRFVEVMKQEDWAVRGFGLMGSYFWSDGPRNLMLIRKDIKMNGYSESRIFWTNFKNSWIIWMKKEKNKSSLLCVEWDIWWAVLKKIARQLKESKLRLLLYFIIGFNEKVSYMENLN